MNAMYLSGDELKRMDPEEIERAFFPLPKTDRIIEAMEDKARELGFMGTAPWHHAEGSTVYDRRDSNRSGRGRMACWEVAVCGGRARYYYCRTGFLQGHYEVDGEEGVLKFNHAGGGGAQHYASALAAVRGLSGKSQRNPAQRFWSSFMRVMELVQTKLRKR